MCACNFYKPEMEAERQSNHVPLSENECMVDIGKARLIKQNSFLLFIV